MTEPEPTHKQKLAAKKDPRVRWFVAILVVGAVLGTVIGGVLSAFYAAYVIPAGSMWPTLTVGTRVFANRRAKTPERGAVVVFKYPERREQSFVKRIIGLPGDVIRSSDDGLTINDWKVPRCVVGKTGYDDLASEGEKHEGNVVVEWLGEATYLVFEDEHAPSMGPGARSRWVVAAGEYFVVGDNRRSSHDSRMWNGGQGGGVPLANTIGRVRDEEKPELPANARDRDKLAGALVECLGKKPPVVTPPPPK